MEYTKNESAQFTREFTAAQASFSVYRNTRPLVWGRVFLLMSSHFRGPREPLVNLVPPFPTRILRGVVEVFLGRFHGLEHIREPLPEGQREPPHFIVQ